MKELHGEKLMVRMELSKIIITETNDYQVIWLREKGGTRTFPILIGIVEAAAIDRFIREIQTPRPLTHDLLANLITEIGATLDRVIVSSLRNNTFYARLILHLDGRDIDVDARPSDAVAVAIRLKAPIYVEESVLDSVAREPGPTASSEEPPTEQ